MPIVKKLKDESQKLKGIKIHKVLMAEIESYCEKFEVTLEDFITQAAQFILKKDKDWKKHKKDSEE